MKQHIVILALLCLTEHPAWGQSKLVKPDYPVIQKTISDSSSSLYYPRLLGRYEEGDSSLTLEEKRHLYYGYQFQPNYNPYAPSSYRDQLRSLLSRDNHTTEDLNRLAAITDSMLAENPLDMDALSYKLYVNDKLGNQSEFTRYRNRGRIILDAIMSTGDGKTERTAFYVIDTSDEYTLVNILGFKFGGEQSLTKDFCDLLSLAPNEKKITGLYFDVHACFDFMSKQMKGK